MIVYDIAETYDGDKPLLAPGGRALQEAFLQAFYGGSHVDAASVERVVARLGYRVLGVVDKYLGTGHRGVGWLVLRKTP